MSIKVFKRVAWKRDRNSLDGWSPYALAPKRHVCYVDTVEQARIICKEHNDNRISRGDPFCEFTSEA